ncbi:Bifunctional 4-hydroxy-2-oxoglutarate aldolase/2-dehydro-3-deoxy-phosphogluconate aldolase [Stackebrandtia soli]
MGSTVTATDFDALFAGQRLMVIIRGRSPRATVELAERAWEIGIRSVEVPIGEPEQVEALVATIEAAKPRGLDVGAGTVVSVEHVRRASEAGAAYTVAPGFDAEVFAASLAAGLPHLPGVATPTEVQRAVGRGCRWLKAFPATTLGATWFSAIRGPFPNIALVATGGVTVHDAQSYLDAGARVVALGSALADPTQVDALARLVVDRET